MPKVKRICRVCGKKYTACRTMTVTPGVFVWQEVACSPECGAKYFRKIHGIPDPEEEEKEDNSPPSSSSEGESS